MRLAGLALLGVAAVATVIGLITLGLDGDGSAATNTPTPTETTTGQDTSEPGQEPTTTATSPTGPTTTTPTLPTTVTTTSPTTTRPDDGKQAHNVRVRVYNNSTIRGHAARAADDIRKAGWSVDEVGNYAAGVIPTSTVYYRPGTPEQAAARALGNQFDLRIEPRFRGLKNAEPGLIVIVTNDYGGK